MPKIQRNITSGSIHHIYNRGVDKMTIFYTDKDYGYFLDKILFYKDKYRVKILAFCLLPNHWHLLLQEPISTPGITDTRHQIVEFIRCLCGSYSHYFNFIHDRSGPLFQSRFKSKLVEDNDYLQTLINYINLNPVKHKLVKNINDWDYTSHWDYLEKEKFNLVDKNELIDFSIYQDRVDDYLLKLEDIEEEFLL